MKTTFQIGDKPNEAYEKWKREWESPGNLTTLPGYVIVEFGPHGDEGAFWQPEEISYNAMVVCDGHEGNYNPEGFIPKGTEIGYIGADGDPMTHNGRVLHRVKKDDIILYFPK